MKIRTAAALPILLALILCALSRPAVAGCPEVLAFLADKAIGVTCVHADDLRVPPPPLPVAGVAPVLPGNNSITTFADGTTALPGIASGNGSFTPVTDLAVISNAPTPTNAQVPGLQVEGWFADDPAGEARFVLRFPDVAIWNGKLVVAGASGTRSEYNGDWAWSDYVLSKGYAYASQNKGVLNLFFVSLASATQPAGPTGAVDKFSCRLNPEPTSAFSEIWVHFYDNDLLAADYPSVGFNRLKPFTEWTTYMLEDARLAQGALKANFNHFPRRTYAVGTSNGGYQVRRAVEAAPNLFDGGVDWEGTFVDLHENILGTTSTTMTNGLPPAIQNFAGYIAGGCNLAGPEATAIMAAGYPPDIVKTCTAAYPPAANQGTLWSRYSGQFWEVTQCQWQKRFDPTWPTYADGPGNVVGTGGYNYLQRLEGGFVDIAQLEGAETTGKIKKPLITVAGTMDALLPIRRQAEAYEAKVNASRKGNNEERNAQYRLYEVQNGNHIEGYVPLFPQLRLIQPFAQNAFDLLVDHVENNAPLPPSQCVGFADNPSISQHPPDTEKGHCTSLLK